jgi:hypothetical protein
VILGRVIEGGGGLFDLAIDCIADDIAVEMSLLNLITYGFCAG